MWEKTLQQPTVIFEEVKVFSSYIVTVIFNQLNIKK